MKLVFKGNMKDWTVFYEMAGPYMTLGDLAKWMNNLCLN